MLDLTVRFWGTRGSVPTPGRATEKYGGNTTCVEARCGGTIVVFDAGTGIVEMGKAWAAEFAGEPISAALLFTHLHWDHIQGFPFLQAAYQPQNALTIIGEDRPGGAMRDQLSGQMQGAYFPIPLSAMRAQFDYRTPEPEFALGPLTVRTHRLAHPGGCLGYRLETGRSTLVFATDCELDQMALNPAEIAADFSAPRRYEPSLLEFFSDAHLLIIDCQYADAVYPARRGWGHNSVTSVADLCRQVRPAAVALTHHDPQSADHDVAAIVAQVERQLRQTDPKRETIAYAAREGLTVRVERPRRPPAVVPAGGRKETPNDAS